MNRHEEILDFINRRFSSNNSNWLNGNCYWFSYILKGRFPEGEIFYEPAVGHFLFKLNNKFYDWEGEYLEDTTLAHKFSKDNDILLYKHLIRDCVL